MMLLIAVTVTCLTCPLRGGQLRGMMDLKKFEKDEASVVLSSALVAENTQKPSLDGWVVPTAVLLRVKSALKEKKRRKKKRKERDT